MSYRPRTLTVPDKATLATTFGSNGVTCIVSSQKSEWTANTTDPGPASIDKVTNPAGGFWVRTDYADPFWRGMITDVYIDDVAGTAENQGIYLATPGLPAPITGAELARRWGRRGTVTGNAAGFAELLIHIQDNSSIPNLDYILNASFVRVLGEKNTVLLAGNLDNQGGFTAQTPTVPVPGGTECTIKVGATVWGPFLGKRIRFTATSAIAYILKDLGGGVARISQPGVTNEAFFFVNPTATNPAQGAAFVVEDLVGLALGHVNVGHEIQTNGFFSQTNVTDVAFTAAGIPFRPTIQDGDNFLVFYQSYMNVGIELDQRFGCNNCIAQNIFVRAHGEGFFYGGAVRPPAGGFPVNVVAGDGGSLAVMIDYYTYFQGCCLIGNDNSTFGGLAIFDAPIVGGGANPAGHALMVGGPPGNFLGSSSIVSQKGNGVIFGTGSNGVGLRCGAATRFVYSTLPNITGGGGQAQLANSAVGYWFDGAAAPTPTYKPTGGIGLTWAAIAAGTGVGGLGGGAHEPDRDAHIVQAAAT